MDARRALVAERADGGIYRALSWARVSVYKRPVFFLNSVVLELFFKRKKGGIRLCDDHNAGCLFIQAVYNAGTKRIFTN